jgi:hypothetical protein
MKMQFGGNIEVVVLRNGREVTRVVRPLRKTAHGAVVLYKRRLWLLDGNTINIGGLPFVEPQVGKVADHAGAEAPNASANEAVSDSAAPLSKAEAQDGSQLGVVDAPPESRLLVDAGPGTGKTHTACLRVAALIRNHDIPASRIWIISFTRAAVHEIRSRLESLLAVEGGAAAVRIATLDSVAWTIHSGFSNDAVLTGSYEGNIGQTLAKIRHNPDVQDELLKLHHLVVDEAQDIVGVRADLVLAMIGAVRPECGVTVFADPAQAIYGFTEDEETKTAGNRFLGELQDLEFEHVSLTNIHRTNSTSLLDIFTGVRSTVLDAGIPAQVRGSKVRTRIEELADSQAGPTKDLKLSMLPNNGLVLMRQRADVLFVSSFNQGTPHRLRMSGLPVRILPWLARLFWNYQERRLMRAAFDDLWANYVAGQQCATDRERVWQLMVDTAGDSPATIDLHRLRTVVGRAGPPAMFTSPEYGDAGPILGTIHASKGREAEEVCLYLPPAPEGDDDDEKIDPDEEIRVMFVGATRARKKLSVGSSPGRHTSTVSGRVWKKITNGRIQVEVGRTGDVDACGLVGRSTFASVKDARRAQEFLSQNPVLTGLRAYAAKELGWNFALETSDGLRLGALTQSVVADLKEIAKRCDWWPAPRSLVHIRSIGLRSVVLQPDDPSTEQLYDPWRHSGFVLAPMLTGICPGKLP